MPYSSWTFCVQTFGCKVNQYESQSLREAWLTMNGTETDDPAVADVVLLNTCAVTANAVADARQAVHRLSREAPEARIIITGCAAEAAGEELVALPGVVAVAGQAGKALLLEQPPLTQLERLKVSPCWSCFRRRGNSVPVRRRIRPFRRSGSILLSPSVVFDAPVLCSRFRTAVRTAAPIASFL